MNDERIGENSDGYFYDQTQKIGQMCGRWMLKNMENVSGIMMKIER